MKWTLRLLSWSHDACPFPEAAEARPARVKSRRRRRKPARSAPARKQGGR